MKNIAFFSLYENVFKTYKEQHGLNAAVAFAKELFKNALGPAYDKEGFKKGSTLDFARTVKSRDESVGLRVDLPHITKNEIVYRFLDDPFPGLKGHVDQSTLDGCYLQFKIDYLLGDGWGYTTTKHIWSGDDYSEHKIEKKKK